MADDQQQVGLRRRYQARFVNQQGFDDNLRNVENIDDDANGNSDEDDDDNDGGEGDGSIADGNTVGNNDENSNNRIPLARVWPPLRPNIFPAARNTNNNTDPEQQQQQREDTSRTYFLTSFIIVAVAIVMVSPPPNVHQLMIHSIDPHFIEYAKEKDGPFNYHDFVQYKERSTARTAPANNNMGAMFFGGGSNSNDENIKSEDSIVVRSNSGLISGLESWLQPIFRGWNFSFSGTISSLLDNPTTTDKPSKQDSSPRRKAASENRDKRSKDLSQPVDGKSNETWYRSIDAIEWLENLFSYWNTNSTTNSSSEQKAGAGDSSSTTQKLELNKLKEKDDRINTKKERAARRTKQINSMEVDGNDDQSSSTINIFFGSIAFQHFYYVVEQFIDPVLLHPTPETPTEVIDKVLTSTPRLLAIANFMLALTYLLHSGVAVWFLGPYPQPRWHHHDDTESVANNNANFPDWSTTNGSSTSSSARERMGGFLVFKLLLVSAVVSPDTFDLLILLFWYTTMSCLRSLDHLAHSTTTHLLALGQPPRKGVVQLLFWIRT